MRGRYLEAATHMGHLVRRFGFLKKGVGLCHGIAGNAYSLLALFRATGDESWLAAARDFAGEAIERFDELRDEPDRPHSLFDGAAGLMALLVDLLQPHQSRFPGFE